MTASDTQPLVPHEAQPVGLYTDVPMREYHGWPGASQSRLKRMGESSPAHVRWEMDHPTPSTPAQVLGEAIHYAALQPDLFETTYVCGPDCDKRSKANKARWAEAEEQGEVLKPDDYDLCLTIRDRLLAHPVACRLLEGDAERSAIWDDPHTGVRCKGRFDKLSTAAPVIVDLKTTRDAAGGAFSRAIYTYGYYIQGAHYRRGARLLGHEIEHFVIVAVEKVEPIGIAVYDVLQDALDAGELELDMLLARYAECEESGVWPSYDPRVRPITLPEWAFRQIDRRTEGFEG